jgi:hypothetical protein
LEKNKRLGKINLKKEKIKLEKKTGEKVSIRY